MHTDNFFITKKRKWLDPEISYIDVSDTASGGGAYPDGETATSGGPDPGS